MKINVNILRIMYEQYFCNICQLSNEQLLSLHFKCNEALDNDEDLFWDDYPLTEMIVWNPFAETMPTHIFENILEGHKRLWAFHDEMYNQVCLEVSSELAEHKVAEYYGGKLPEIKDPNDDVRLDAEATELFMLYQEEFENIVRGCTQKP